MDVPLHRQPAVEGNQGESSRIGECAQVRVGPKIARDRFAGSSAARDRLAMLPLGS
jgi:hypothetical protein